MKSVALTAFPRTLARGAGVKRLRTTGRLPAVIYGRLNKPQNVEFDQIAFREVMKQAASEIVLLDLAIEGDAKPKRLAIVQEVQHHPLTRKMLHVDLHEVAEDEKVTAWIEVESSGEPAGVKTGGGTLEHVLFKLKVRALPKDLPETLVVEVGHLEIGQAIHIGDIKPPAGVEILGDKHISVLAVAAPVSEAQEAAVLEAATAPAGEVEMIKEKKEEGEEGEVPAGEKAPAKGAEKGAAGKPAAEGAAAAPAAEKGAEKKGEKKAEKKKK